MNITLPPGFGAGALRTLHKARRARPLRQKQWADHIAELQAIAMQLGYPGDTSDLSAMARWCWEREPSPELGELLEELADAGVIDIPYF